jgi:hypothetical protein
MNGEQSIKELKFDGGRVERRPAADVAGYSRPRI